MEFRSIIPANKTVTISRSVASILSLVLDNGKLSIVKYTEQGSIIWSRELGDYGQRPSEFFALKEDEEAFIHIVTNFSGIFRPFYNSIERPVETTLVLKLSSSGEVLYTNIISNLLGSVLVKIKNDVWMVSNYRFISPSNDPTATSTINTINIRNLSTGGNIRDIFFNGPVIASSAFHLDDKLFIAGGTAANVITYKNKTYRLGNVGAMLLIINTDLWTFWDYFIAMPEFITDIETKSCNAQNETTPPFMTFEAVVVDGGYFLAGRTANTNRISFYHRKDLIEVIELMKPNITILCRFLPTIRKGKIREVKFKSIVFPTEFRGSLQLIISKGDLLLKGFVFGDALFRFLVGKETEILHNKSVLFVLQISQDLEVLGHTFIGTPSLGHARGDNCGCDQCRDENDSDHWRGIILPCIPMRLFPPGPKQLYQACKCCKGRFDQLGTLNNQENGDRGDGFLDYPLYTCKNDHCGPRAEGNGSTPQKGDLYNTKYNLNYVPTPASASANPNSGSSNDQMIEIEQNTSIVIFNQLIDKLLINGVVKKVVYNQVWHGFLLFFNL